MIFVLLLVLIKVKKMIKRFKSVIFYEELQGITNGEALKGGEEALTGNVEVLNDDDDIKTRGLEALIF